MVVVISSVFLLAFASLVSRADRGSQPRIVANYQKEHWLSAGDMLRLNCPVSSEPAPIFLWSKDGNDIHIGWERFRIRGEVLQIKPVEPGDSGVYVCSATNGFGTINVQYFVCVSGNDTVITPMSRRTDTACNFNNNGELPMFDDIQSMKEQNVQLVEGETKQLSCHATGKPKPEIRWFKDGKELSRNHNEAGNNFLLTLRNVTIDDEGSYMCNVFSRIGSINFTYTIKVTGRQISPTEFRLSLLKNITIPVGATASFHCEVYSDVETRIQWLKQISSAGDKQNPNYTIVVEDKHFTVIQRSPTQVQSEGRYLSKLTIRPAGLNDSGIYVCSAANSHGFRLQSAFLKVIPNKDTLTTEQPDNISQFLPIVATIASMFLILVVGIIICLVFRHCLPSDRCSSSTVSQPRSPSSVLNYASRRTFDTECADSSILPLKGQYNQQLLCPGYWGHDRPSGPQGPTTATKYLVPASQREQLLYSQQQQQQHQQPLPLHYYEHC